MKKWISLLMILTLLMGLNLTAYAEEPAAPATDPVQTQELAPEAVTATETEEEPEHKGLSRNQMFFGFMVVCVVFLMAADLTGGKED